MCPRFLNDIFQYIVQKIELNIMGRIFWGVYRAGTKYTVSVFGMFDGGESMPLAGEEKTTLSDEPELPPYEPTGKVIEYSVYKTFISMIKMYFIRTENVFYFPTNHNMNN